MTRWFLVWALFGVCLSAYQPRELFRAYCHLVKDHDFAKKFNLADLCELYVKQFDSKVKLLHKNSFNIKKTLLIT